MQNAHPGQGRALMLVVPPRFLPSGRHSLEYGFMAYIPVRITLDNSGFLTSGLIRKSILKYLFQFAASGGFSVLLPDPAFTIPGIADSETDLLVPIIAFSVFTNYNGKTLQLQGETIGP